VIDVQSFISKELHSLLFLEEFVFARNKFSASATSELELADAVVMLGDVLIIYQIKERSPKQGGDAAAEHRWFQAKVLGKATKQVRDTLRYLETYAEVYVPNERGRIFNLAAGAFTEILKVVVYMPSPNLPADCRCIRHHISGSAGLIHILDARDYLELARTLRVPEEVVRYFRYREAVLTRFTSDCGALPEPAIAGHFVGGDPNVRPTVLSAIHLHRLVDDAVDWDLAPFMRGLHDHLATPEGNDDYYEILIEFAKLPRSVWRTVKERIVHCLGKVSNDELARPYRIVDPRTGCGFVFIPVTSELVRNPNWSTIKLRGLKQLTAAHKYDQRLSKCIGVIIGKDGKYFDISWCLINGEWARDPDLESALAANFPFRPVKLAEIQGYHLRSE